MRYSKAWYSSSTLCFSALPSSPFQAGPGGAVRQTGNCAVKWQEKGREAWGMWCGLRSAAGDLAESNYFLAYTATLSGCLFCLLLKERDWDFKHSPWLGSGSKTLVLVPSKGEWDGSFTTLPLLLSKPCLKVRGSDTP